MSEPDTNLVAERLFPEMAKPDTARPTRAGARAPLDTAEGAAEFYKDGPTHGDAERCIVAGLQARLATEEEAAKVVQEWKPVFAEFGLNSIRCR